MKINNNKEIQKISDDIFSNITIDNENSLLYLNNKNIENNFNNFPIVKLHEYNLDKEINFKINKLPNLSSIRKEIDFKFINRFFKINYNKHIFICSRSNGSLERIKKIYQIEVFENIPKIVHFQIILQ